MQPPVLELSNLRKTIRDKEIIRGISLTLRQGEILGFLGPNGAGKTTTIRMIVGLIKPTGGSIKICGIPLAEDFIGAMSNVGCIIESPELYQFLTGWDNLMQFANMDKRVTRQRVREVVELVGLQNRINDKVNTYSLGMRQRLGIAQALLSRPKLLILDEPTNGLDPAGINEFRHLIKNLAEQEGMAIFVSSHLLAEVQQMCDQVAIIKQGTVVKTAAVREVLLSEVVEWQVSAPEAAIKLLREEWGISASAKGSKAITAALGKHRLEDINRALITAGIELQYACPQQHNLEDLFLDLTEGDQIV